MSYKDPEKNKAYMKAWRQAHRKETNERQRAWWKANKEKINERRRAQAPAHREQRRAAHYAYYTTHKAEVLRHKHTYYQEHKERWRHVEQEVRRAVLEHYSTPGHPNCLHCGEDDVDVLCIDHINNDGYEHRKAVGGGSRLYRWLKNNSYPEGFQVLCYNCNRRKEIQYRRNKAEL